MTIEFNEKDHTYQVNSIDTPSVTQLVSILHPDTYNGVPKKTLEKKAAYGTRVHALIENAALHDVWERAEGFESISLNRFRQLKEQYEIKASSCEQHVAYVKDGVPLYAGTYDMVGTVGGVNALIDIKTTAEMHTDMLQEQLFMYKQAIEQMGDMKIDKTYCLWMPKKDLGNLVEINLLSETVMMKRIEDAWEAYWSRI